MVFCCAINKKIEFKKKKMKMNALVDELNDEKL